MCVTERSRLNHVACADRLPLVSPHLRNGTQSRGECNEERTVGTRMSSCSGEGNVNICFALVCPDIANERHFRTASMKYIFSRKIEELHWKWLSVG